MIRVAGWSISTTVRKGLALLSRVSPTIAYGAVDFLMGIRGTPPELEASVRRLLPSLLDEDIRRIAARLVTVEQRNLVAVDAMRRDGFEAVRSLTRPHASFARMQTPVILGTFHIGAEEAITVPMTELPGEVFVMRRHLPQRRRSRASIIQVTPESDEKRALAFHDALKHLQSGTSGVMALDAEHGAKIGVPFLGHTLRLSRGPFALARHSGVRIVLVTARWRGAEIEIVEGPSLLPEKHADGDRMMAGQAARWLERYLTDHPEEISRRILDLMS